MVWAFLVIPGVQHGLPKLPHIDHPAASGSPAPVAEVNKVWHLAAVDIRVLCLFPFLMNTFPSDFLEMFMILGLGLVSWNTLDPWSIPRVHHVVPVLGSLLGQVPPPLYDEHTGVAQLPLPRLRYSKTIAEGCLIFAAACESWTAWLCFTNAAAALGSEDLWFVESCHRSLKNFRYQVRGNISKLNNDCKEGPIQELMTNERGQSWHYTPETHDLFCNWLEIRMSISIESQLGLGSSKEISSKRKVNALSGFSARQPVSVTLQPRKCQG